MSIQTAPKSPAARENALATPVRLPTSGLALGGLALTALLLVAAPGCTTPGNMDLPDVFIPVDSGNLDGGFGDGAFPPPVVDTCRTPGVTLGDACADSELCNDGCYCNGIETCSGGVCVAGADPCTDTVECTDEACLEETDTCFHMPNHALCSNSMACDGYEQCDRFMGCVPGAPLYCNDESACTVDSCDDGEGCVYTPRDLDGDGFISGACGGEDCDDDPRYGTMIYPGAAEVCDNRRDDDCDGFRDFRDSDCLPTNDTCDTATVLPARSGTYSGGTTGLRGDFTLSCVSGSRPDAVFRVTLTEPQDLRIAVSGITNAAVALRPFAMCATGPDEKCGAGSAPTILRRSLPAGDWAIIVSTGAGGAFDINLLFGPPTPIPPVDICGPGTETIVEPGGRFTGRFEEVEDDYALSCHGGTGWRDAAYRFTITSPKDVTITASTTGSSTPTTYVSLVTDCASPASTVTCQSAFGTLMLRRRGLPPGTYYVLVESSRTDATEWTMDVAITDPAPRAPGDACSTAVPVPLADVGGGVFRGMGSGELAMADLGPDAGTSCGGATTSSRDLFFYFDLPSTRDVTLTTNGAGFHYVSLNTECGVFGTELRCRSGSGAVGNTWRSLPAGRYYVTVATTLSSGTVTATVETRPPTPIPPNDRCTGAIVLTSGSSRRDTLVGFEDDLAGCTGSGYPDAFYTFTLATRRRVIISVSNAMGAPGARMYLTLRNTCGAGTNLACENDDPAATINATLDAGTYFVFVEQLSSSTSDFTLDYVDFAP